MKTTAIQKNLGKGRPRAQAGENKRERILDSAIFLFARHGVSETTVAQIAEKSGVTSAMVHYYFKNWDGLLDTIMVERIVPKIEYVWNGMEKITSVPELLKVFIDRLFTVMEENLFSLNYGTGKYLMWAEIFGNALSNIILWKNCKGCSKFLSKHRKEGSSIRNCRQRILLFQ